MDHGVLLRMHNRLLLASSAVGQIQSRLATRSCDNRAVIRPIVISYFDCVV